MDVCPRCKHEDIRKDGVVKNKQRFKCKVCNYHFTVVKIGKPFNLKRISLLLYLLGFNYRQTGKFLNVSHVTVYKWIMQFGAQVRELKGEKPQKADIEGLVEQIGANTGKGAGITMSIGLCDGEIEMTYAEN